MIFIFGVISIVFKKNTLCTNKICVIYFCPNCVNFFLENVQPKSVAYKKTCNALVVANTS